MVIWYLIFGHPVFIYSVLRFCSNGPTKLISSALLFLALRPSHFGAIVVFLVLSFRRSDPDSKAMENMGVCLKSLNICGCKLWRMSQRNRLRLYYLRSIPSCPGVRLHIPTANEHWLNLLIPTPIRTCRSLTASVQTEANELLESK